MKAKKCNVLSVLVPGLDGKHGNRGGPVIRRVRGGDCSVQARCSTFVDCTYNALKY